MFDHSFHNKLLIAMIRLLVDDVFDQRSLVPIKASPEFIDKKYNHALVLYELLYLLEFEESSLVYNKSHQITLILLDLLEFASV